MADYAITGPSGALGTEASFAVSGADTLRIKAFNSWPQAEQVISTDPLRATAGPENFMFKLVVKFRRTSNPKQEVTCTKIGCMDNDRAANGFASGGIMAYPFGAAAGKGRTVSDANCTFNSRTINSFSVANPTQVTTSAPHGFTTGDLVLISGTTSTPNADGLWYVQNAAGSTFNIALNITASSTGTVATSRTLTSATAAFTTGDVGKNITLSVGGQVCPSDGTFGTGQPWAGLTPTAPCQGPKFPFQAAAVNYQGVIIGFTNSTTVTVKPSMVVNPNGTGVLKIEPALLADSDGLELGDGWITGIDINYWQGTPKPGQSQFEVELNRNIFNAHEGITLIPKSYLETSGHLAWPYGRPGPTNSVSGHGWTRVVPVTVGVGLDWTATVPPNTHWKILSVIGALTTSGTAANRLVSIAADDGTNVIFTWVSQLIQTATQVTVYNLFPGAAPRSFVQAVGTTIRQYGELPIGLELLEGGRLRSTTQNLQPAGAGQDVWSVVSLLVEEFIEE